MKRRSGPTESQPRSDLAALALVDGALSAASRRRAFERDEAERLLRDASPSVGESAVAAAIAAVVEEGVVAFGDGALVDRTRVVDVLLDIRSLLQRNGTTKATGAAVASPDTVKALAR